MLNIRDEKELIKQMELSFEDKTICLVGREGLGKTTIIETFFYEMKKKKKLDKMFIFRMQGIPVEEIQGIPYRAENDELRFAKMGAIHYVINHPEERVLLFCDEWNRAQAEVETILFQLFESKIEGKKYDNLFVIGAINMGEEFSTNIDISDMALRRRMVFFEYLPNRTTFLNFIKEKNYHPTILEAAELMKIHYNFDIAGNAKSDENRIEQSSNFSSWKSWDHRLKKLEEISGQGLTLDEIINDFMIYSSVLYFNIKLSSEIQRALYEIKKSIKIDIPEILVSGKIPDSLKTMEQDILLRLKKYLLEEIENRPKILEENAENIYALFDKNKDFLMVMFQEIKEKYVGSVAKIIIPFSRKCKDMKLMNEINIILSQKKE